MNKNTRLVLAVLAISLCISTVAIVTYMFTSGVKAGWYPNTNRTNEKLLLTKTFVNGTSNVIFVDVHVIASDHTVKINSAIIKNYVRFFLIIVN